MSSIDSNFVFLEEVDGSQIVTWFWDKCAIQYWIWALLWHDYGKSLHGFACIWTVYKHSI